MRLFEDHTHARAGFVALREQIVDFRIDFPRGIIGNIEELHLLAHCRKRGGGKPQAQVEDRQAGAERGFRELPAGRDRGEAVRYAGKLRYHARNLSCLLKCPAPKVVRMTDSAKTRLYT